MEKNTYKKIGLFFLLLAFLFLALSIFMPNILNFVVNKNVYSSGCKYSDEYSKTCLQSGITDCMSADNLCDTLSGLLDVVVLIVFMLAIIFGVLSIIKRK